MPCKAYMKRPGIRTLIILFVIATCILLFYQVVFNNNKPLYIALVLPKTGPKADPVMAVSIRQGVNLYIDKLNENGGINGKKIIILEYDDHGDDETTKQIATQIAKDGRILAVIGHLFSSNSLAAGQIYKEHGIPAISSTSSADELTEGNEWYFRTVPNNRLNGAFLANYTIRALRQSTASIIYNSQDAYSTSLTKGFKLSFKGLGGTIKREWDLNAQNKNETIERIVKDILRDPAGTGLIFISSQGDEPEELIVSMKRKGIDNLILGGDALGETSFADGFKKYPEEQAQPGYFTDGLYACSPMIFDIADKTAQQFKEEYLQKYHQEPGWQTATSYDAALVLVEAIAKTGVKENMPGQRQKIRDYLANLTNIDQAVKGVSGNIYFDKQRNIAKSVVIGLFNKQKFISALTQFQPFIKPNPLMSDFETELNNGRIVSMGGKYMYRTNAVYTGIYFNEISNLSEADSTYDADFYQWFRYQGQIDASNIQFINSVAKDGKEVELGPPIVDKKLNNDTTYQLYRVKGKFAADFDFHSYPFDEQDLTIRFRHANLTHENLIYVIDVVGIHESIEDNLEKIKRTMSFEPSGDWSIQNVTYFQDGMVTESSLGNLQVVNPVKVEYSTFNSTITIKRYVLSFIIRNLFPVFFVLILAYLGLYLPISLFEAKMGLVSGSIMTIAFFHWGLSTGLPGIGYTVALDYAFYTVYALMVLELFIIVVDLHKYDSIEILAAENETLKKEQPTAYDIAITKNENLINWHENVRATLTFIGQVSYPITLAMLVVAFMYLYEFENFYPTQSKMVVSPPVIESAPDLANSFKPSTSQNVVLRLGSWRIDDIEQLSKILTVFNTTHPTITVKFEPSAGSSYEKNLIFQLENGTAPDLFYLSSSVGRTPNALQLFEDGHLAPLNDLPQIEDIFTPDALNTWSAFSKGETVGSIYALPLAAVSHGIYYNVDLFKQLNLKIPTTWPELLTAAETITKAGYVPFANGIYPTDKNRIGDSFFFNLAPTFIGGVEGRLKYGTGERCFNDKHIVAIYQALQDLTPFLPPERETLTYYTGQQLFLQGQAAMWLNGSWDIASFETSQPAFEWSAFAVPALPGQAQYVAYHIDTAIALNAKSPHQVEARQFLAWVATPEFAELFAHTLPGFFPLQKQMPKIQNPHANAFLALNQQARGTDVRWKLPVGLPDGRTMMQDNALEVFRGKLTPQQAADNLQKGLMQWFEPAQRCMEAGK